MLCLVYDATFDGFLSAVFEAFRLKNTGLSLVRENQTDIPGLFEILRVETDPQKAGRVSAGMDAISREWIKTLYSAWLSEFEGIDDDILNTLALGFSQHKNPMSALYEPCVRRVADADCKVGREAFRYQSFVRFMRVGDDLFVSDIEPMFDILPLIGRHFHLRYGAQRFIIRDLVRARAVVSERDGWHIAPLSGDQLMPLGTGGEIEQMWRRYFEAIANQSRKNTKLQQKFIPLRYRKYLTEFQ